MGFGWWRQRIRVSDSIQQALSIMKWRTQWFMVSAHYDCDCLFETQLLIVRKPNVDWQIEGMWRMPWVHEANLRTHECVSKKPGRSQPVSRTDWEMGQSKRLASLLTGTSDRFSFLFLCCSHVAPFLTLLNHVPEAVVSITGCNAVSRTPKAPLGGFNA